MSQEIRAIVSGDGMRAELIVPPSPTRSPTIKEECLSACRAAGIEGSADFAARLKDILESLDLASETRELVAQGQPAQHGEDARLEWFIKPDRGFSNDLANDNEEQSTNAGDTSHYDRSTIDVAQSGQVIGHLHPVKEGADGRDVFGNTLAAKSGKPVHLEHDETIERASDGRLIAQIEGILKAEGHKATICEYLEVPENVDFSTGNIEFDGEVRIRGDVKDLFTVEASGSVFVNGLAEAATFVCGKDLILRGGMAARERGSISVKRDARVKYLDAVKGDVGGNLHFTSEVINSRLVVHGSVGPTRGSIIGTTLTVVGAVRVGQVGSTGPSNTRIVLGTVPKLEPLFDEFVSLVEQLEQHLESVNQELAALKTPGKRKTHGNAERETELTFEIESTESRLAAALQERDRFAARIEELRTVDLNVERHLHAGAIIELNGRAYKISESIRGPLRIALGAGDEPMLFRTHDDPGQPLNQFTSVQLAA
ncbi:MAG: FapA family protein [Planctomycetota bacterium]